MKEIYGCRLQLLSNKNYGFLLQIPLNVMNKVIHVVRAAKDKFTAKCKPGEGAPARRGRGTQAPH